jgi:NADH-quinone oxidoreductase subunit B
VVNGVHELLPVDLWVPGCPPRPAALRDALLELDHRLGGGTPTAAAAPTELLRGRPA